MEIMEMLKSKKKVKTKNPFLSFLEHFYQIFEGYSFESDLFKYFVLYIYFFQATSYIYFFLLKDVKSKTAYYYCYFHYYLNLTSLIHGLNYIILFFVFFSIYFGINILLVSFTLYNICCLSNKKKGEAKQNFFLKMINFLCDIYNRFILIQSIDIFLSLFQKSDRFFDEHPYFKSETIQNHEMELKVMGTIGCILSFILSLFFLYLNQDYKFLDKTKFRVNFSIMKFIVFLLRIIQTFIFRIYSDLEWFHYILAYLFLFIELNSYLTEFPFRNSQISKFYISALMYSIMNIFLLSLHRIGMLRTEVDLFMSNLIMCIMCFKLGNMIYERYYMNFLVHETKESKAIIFTLEELINLYMNAKSSEKLNLLLYGYFKFHYKSCTNERCTMHKEVFLKYEKLTPENKKYFIIDYVYFNFCDIISMGKNKRTINSSKNKEIIYAKFLTFLISYGVNPIKKFYEIQKVLYERLNFSLYFNTMTSILNQEVSKQIQLYLERIKYDSTITIMKNTYVEFFKAASIKGGLEKDFKKLLYEKIIYFEKAIDGQSLEALFFANLKFYPMIKNFYKDLGKLNSKSTFCNVLKYKYLSLLYSLILNNFAKAVIFEKKLHDEFTSKSNEHIDKSYIREFFENDTVLCEASFLDYSGPILEKSKTSKFLSFFGYENNEAYKVKYVNDLVPNFLKSKHETLVSNYLNQRRPVEKAQLQTFAADNQGFIFPITIIFSLKYDYFEDFVLVGAIRKVKNYGKKICLIDFKGNIIHISNEFFYDLKQQYSFLEIEDVVFINIFKLVPELNKYLHQNNDDKFTAIKNIKSKLYFPDKMKDYIIESKLKDREDKKIKSYMEQKNHLKTFTSTRISNSNGLMIGSKTHEMLKTRKEYQSNFTLDSSHPEIFRTAEIKFDLSIESVKYGNADDEKITYFVLKIKKYKKPISLDRNYDNIVEGAPEDVMNSAIIDQSKTNHIDGPKVIHIMAMENNEEEGLGFKCKIHDLQGSPIRITKKETNDHPESKNNTQKAKMDFESNNFSGLENKVKNLTHQMSSNSSEVKCETTIFSTIKSIKKITPKPLRFILMILLLQIPLLIIFASVVFKSSENFISQYFIPTQKSLVDFSQQYHYNTMMMLANLRLEYFSLGLIDFSSKSPEIEILKWIFAQSNPLVKVINDKNRNSISEQTFQQNYKKTSVLFVDPLNMKLSKILYIEFVDEILNAMLEPILINLNYSSIKSDNFIFFQRNFPYYLSASENIYAQIQAEFYVSNIPIQEEVRNAMIIFFVLYIFIKLIEVYKWNDFMKTLKILLMLFSRTNETEISQNVFMLKNFQKVFNETTDDYFKTNVVDISKKENISQITNKAKGKKGKKNLYNRFKVLPKYGMIVYIVFSIFLFGFYFVYNYYNWNTLDNYVTKLINLDKVFVNSYIYLTSVVCLEELLLREKIIDNPSYSKINEPYQTKIGRIDFFKTTLDKRLIMIGNTSALYLLNDGLKTFKEHESTNLAIMLKGNLCLLIVSENDFKKDSEQFLLCEKLLNNAFQKGISTVLTSLIQKIKSRETNLQNTETQSQKIIEQQEMIKDYIKSADYSETLLSNFYIHLILEHYYDLNQEYFFQLLEQQKRGFNIFLFVSMSITILIVLFLVIQIQTKVLEFFKSSCLVLSLIPYERMMTDEQILIFLKKFLKSYE